MNFCTTYVNKKGEVVSNSRSIAINYFKSWFVVDVLAAIPFDVIYAFDFFGDMRVIEIKITLAL